MLLQGYGSTVDEPLATLAPEIASILPDAKVVLSVRDSSAAWWKSFQVLSFVLSPQFLISVWPCFAAYRAQLAVATQGFIPLHESRLQEWNNGKPVELGPEYYEKHNQMMMSMFSKEKLLIHNPKEGWKPLCEFLDVPIPNVPYPRRNEGAGLTRGLRKMMWLGFGTWTVIIAVSAMTVFTFWEYFELGFDAILKQMNVR